MQNTTRRQPRCRNVDEYSGEESLIISRTRIAKKDSVVTSVIKLVPSEDGKLPADSKPPADSSGEDTNDESYFRAALKRELDEDKLVIQQKLSTGGMGAIYYVYDRDFQRYSAMKVILPDLKHNSTTLSSFIREARITGQLEHPNICPVHDLGFLPRHGIYFTMKLIQGEPLIDILRELELGGDEYIKKYDFYALLNIFRKVCDAVAFAHSQNIIHRDIKPHNVMVGSYGEVLLMDWGLAKLVGDSEPDADDSEVESVPSSAGLASATERGIIKGSPSYMSPEQARGNSAELDERSDVFLLGTTLYHIFTFYPPYLGDDIYEIVMKAQNVDTTSPDQMDTGVLQLPEELCNIIGKAMAPEKADRYQTVEELVTELDALLRGEMIYEHRVFEAGELLMCEGDLGTESYIIANGKVRVVKERNGAAVELGILSDGDIVGEMALITHEPRSATVTAVTRTDVMVLNQDFFNRNLKLLPPWMSKTIVSLAERLNAANTKNLS